MRLFQISICIAVLTGTGLAQTTVTTSGTTSSGTVPVFNGTATVTNSPISVSGSNVGIGTTSPQAPLNLGGTQFQIFDPSQAQSNYSYMKTTAYTFNTQLMTLGTTYGYGTPVDALSIFNGSVGIGTTSPSQRLDVSGWARFEGNGSANYSDSGALEFYNNVAASSNVQAQIRALRGPNDWKAGQLAFFTAAPSSGSLSQQMTIDQTGNVGIGTTSPGAKLEINGNIKLTNGSGALITYADGTTQATAWTGVLCGGDYAEAVNASGGKKSYEPGDVLVLTSGDRDDVQKSQAPYSTMVAGIYATKPGVIGRRQNVVRDSDDVPMAMVGIVPTKVSAENGPIHKGDLLVSSSTPGYAMKGTDRSRMLGAVIGKAMQPLESGQGVIEVLVTLQ